MDHFRPVDHIFFLALEVNPRTAIDRPVLAVCQLNCYPANQC